MKKLIQNSILLIMAVALIAGILWARYRSQGEVCSGVNVEVINADSTSFVTPQGVLSDLEHQGLKFVGKRMSDINASDVEMRQDLLLNNKKIYAPENTDRSASASSLGIDYVVQSLRFTPDAPDFSEDGLELCFSNDEMRIYKVTESN